MIHSLFRDQGSVGKFTQRMNVLRHSHTTEKLVKRWLDCCVSGLQRKAKQSAQLFANVEIYTLRLDITGTRAKDERSAFYQKDPNLLLDNGQASI
jgi:hypothetical protein